MSSGFALPDDLLIGDLILGNDLRPEEYIDRAWEEIEAKLGFVYEIPIPAVITAHEESLLKSIHVKLATARLLASTAAASGNEVTGLYSQSLLVEVTGMLDRITVGGEVLPSLVLLASDSDGAKAPIIAQTDTSSPFEHYYGYMSGQTVGETWLPGTH